MSGVSNQGNIANNAGVHKVQDATYTSFAQPKESSEESRISKQKIAEMARYILCNCVAKPAWILTAGLIGSALSSLNIRERLPIVSFFPMLWATAKHAYTGSRPPNNALLLQITHDLFKTTDRNTLTE